MSNIIGGGVIATGSIPRLLQEGINSVYDNEYSEHTTRYDLMFDTKTSKKNYELDVQLGDFGLLDAKPEGDDINYDSTRQGFTPKYIHTTFAKGFVITKEALADELYDQFMNKTRMLAKSARITKETVGADVYNNGFDSAFTMTDGDGQPLFSTAHVFGPAGGTYQNKLTVDADLTEASLEDMLNLIGNAEDSRGKKIALEAERLIVPTQERYNAQRILGSVLQNDTGNNATNAMRDMKAFKSDWAWTPYLTDSDAWFVKTNVNQGMCYFERQADEFGQDNAFSSGNARFKVDGRYSFGWTNPRGAYGSAGS